MKKCLFSMLFLVFASMSVLSAQNLTPPAAGEYLTSQTEKQSIQGVPVPKKIECKLEKSDQDYLEIGFRTPNGRYFTYEEYHRVKGNVFAAKKSDGTIATPVKSYLTLRDAGVMEVYRMNGNKVQKFFIVANEDAKFSALKKAAKKNVAAFDASGMGAEVTKMNVALEQEKVEAEKKRLAERKAKEEAEAAERAKAKAERLAKEKAAAEAAAAARANADLCTPLTRYFKMASANYKGLEGKLDKEETELEEENVYFTNEVLPLFNFGRVAPTWKEGVKELQFLTKYWRTKAEADAELAYIQTKIDACFKNKAGFKYNLDSEMHFYKSGAINMTLMRKTDYDDDFKSVYRVLLQVKKR